MNIMSESIYKDISERTEGNIYIGVVGPVRSGKSTLITKLMNVLVIPAIADENIKDNLNKKYSAGICDMECAGVLLTSKENAR